MSILNRIRRALAPIRRRRSTRKASSRTCPLQVQLLEGRLLLDGMSLVGQWDNGTRLYSDGWGETNYAYIGHYANNNGMQILDISDPTNPTLVSTFLSASGWNDFRDIETVQQGDRTIAFSSSDTGGGVIVVDVTDHAAPRELYRITSADNGSDRVHTLSVDGDYLYEADSRTPNVRVFDISDPEHPAFLRLIRSDSGGPVHEVTALNGRLYTAVIDSRGRSEVYDVSNVGDPTAPVPLLASIASGSYAHTAWPTEDGNYVAVARETFGGDVRLWDIRDPSTPVLASTISLPTTQTYSLHQVMIRGDLLYVSAYQAGVLVYDITDPTAPVQVGSYKTYDGPVDGYAGCWGVYPFLGNDRILAFDMQTGLYVLSLDSMRLPGRPGSDDHAGIGINRPGDAGLFSRELLLASASHGGASDLHFTTPHPEASPVHGMAQVSGLEAMATPLPGINKSQSSSGPLFENGSVPVRARGPFPVVDTIFAEPKSYAEADLARPPV